MVGKVNVLYETFKELDGTPLEGGYIYVGTAGLNPETDPISVFIDEALSLPIAQPIRTIGGAPMASGTPTKLFFSGSQYSITTRDASLSLVNTELTVTDRAASTTVNDIASLKLVTGIANQTAFVLSYYAPNFALAEPYDNGGGHFAWDSTSTETDDGGITIKATATATGRWIRIFSGSVNVEWFGTKGDGSTNDAAPIQAAIDYLSSGGDMVIPPANTTYLVSTQLTVTAYDFGRINISAYGAEITTSGAISGIKLTGSSVSGGISIFGLKINQRGDSDATFGFELKGTWNAKLRDCIVEAHGVSATYAAYSLEQIDSTDAGTGCFWTLLDGCWCRKRSGGDVGNITYGLQIKGACNATTVRSCTFNTVITGIHHTIHSAQTVVANALLIDDAKFEGYTTAYHLEGATTSNIAGPKIINSRFETGTTVFSMTTTTTQPSVPIFFAGNYLVSDAGTYLNNPEDLYYTSYDVSITPALNNIAPHIVGPLSVRALSAADHPVKARTQGGSRGIILANATDATCLSFLWDGAGTSTQINGVSAGDIRMRTVGGISQTTAHAENLRGSVTLSSGSAGVVFGTAEPNNSYFITLAGSVNETFSWSAKATGGFTITSSNGSSTAVVDWILIR